jgi:hypothetical protein
MPGEGGPSQSDAGWENGHEPTPLIFQERK